MTAARTTTASGPPTPAAVPTADGSVPEDVRQLTRSLQVLMMAVGHFRSVVAEDLDITMNDSLALQILDVVGPMSQIDLGRRLRLTSSSITALVDRLEAAGYAERGPDPTDRRRSIVTMTARAAATMEAARHALGSHLVAEVLAEGGLPGALERLADGVAEIETIRT